MDHAPEGGKRCPKLVRAGVTGHGVLKAEGKQRISPRSVPFQAVRLSQGVIGVAVERFGPYALLHDLMFLPLCSRKASKKVP